MDKKDKKKIDSLFVKLEYCKDADEFYSLCSNLYYNVNKIVFNLEKKRFGLNNINE